MTIDMFAKLRRSFMEFFLIAIAFLLPIETLLPVNLFRLTEVAVIAAWFFTLVRRRPFPPSTTLRIAAITGVAGVIISLPFAANQRISLDTGILEVAVTFALIHTYSAWKTTEALQGCMTAFVFGTAILSAYQIIALYSAFPHGVPPFSAIDFMAVKDNVGVVQNALTIGNSDNFATLWTLAFPLSVGLVSIWKPRWSVALASVVICYAGLLLYSRSALIAAILATGLLCARSAFTKRINVASLAALAVLCGVTFDPRAVAYFTHGIEEFQHASLWHSSVLPAAIAVTPSADNQALVAPTRPAPSPSRAATSVPARPAPIATVIARPSVVTANDEDSSGTDRAAANAMGIRIAIEHWLTGIGFGMYSSIDPVLTSPHSQLLLWFSEGGILSLTSIVTLCTFIGKAVFDGLRGKLAAPAFVASVAASSMLLKAIVFGGSFSVSSNFVWGAGLAILFAAIGSTECKKETEPMA